DARAGLWRGDLLMIGAATCMALYNVWSRPFIQRSGAIPFTAIAMTTGAIALLFLSSMSGGLAAAARFGAREWAAVGFLGILGSAVTFYLWSLALEHTTPTRVAVSVTVNPIAAGLFGAVLLNEPIGWNHVVGLIAVMLGIGIATTRANSQARTSSPVGLRAD